MGGNRELAERFIASLEARDWDAWAGLLHPAVVYEIPQSRERIRGRDRYLRFNQEYPGDWHLRPKVTIADERHAVVWFEWLLDSRTDDAMAFFEFADGLITRVTDFWPEPYEPPPGREHLVERWLTGPAQQQPAQRRGRVLRGAEDRRGGGRPAGGRTGTSVPRRARRDAPSGPAIRMPRVSSPSAASMVPPPPNDHRPRVMSRASGRPAASRTSRSAACRRLSASDRSAGPVDAEDRPADLGAP